MLAMKSPILQRPNEKIDILTLSPVDRKLYESRMKLERRYNDYFRNVMQRGS